MQSRLCAGAAAQKALRRAAPERKLLRGVERACETLRLRAAALAT